MKAKLCLAAVLACVAAVAAEKPAAPPGGGVTNLLIRGVPHVRQKPDFCGEACAEMFLRKLGHGITQDAVFNASGADPLQGRGCRTPELAQGLRRIGFDVGPVWHSVRAGNASEIGAVWDALAADLARGIPSIVCMRTGAGTDASEHFRLVLGYDAATGEVIYHEPADDKGAYVRMKRDAFLRLWPLRYAADMWTVIRLRLEPAEIRPLLVAGGFTNADYAQHVRTVRGRVPASGFTVVLRKPFVVIGDESPAMVSNRAVHTVQWAVDRLQAAYFEKDPAEILDIWLFRDDASYRKHTAEIFADTPTTPFGYYSDTHRALIMNIGTGGGTLVHEIVHPFMAANFPNCPSWFNEGLASLYEQSSERDGGIVGLTNWRLAGLQEAIRKKELPSFRDLTATGRGDFYAKDEGTNYAQARYLCYYLQEKGLLRTFYRRFRDNCVKDPTGYDTLQAVLGEKDMAAFQKKWEAFVLALRFP